MSKKNTLTDQEIERLVVEAQSGNTEAFGDIYDHFFDSIYRHVYYKVSESYVEDTVGVIFIKAWENIQKYKKTVGFRAWLFRIAHNTIIDHYRTHKQDLELSENVEDARLLHNPNVQTERKLVSKYVHKAISKLKKSHQQIVILKFIDEIPNNEISQILKISEANVRTLQFRALRKLRSIIEEMENTAEAQSALRVLEPRKIAS